MVRWADSGINDSFCDLEIYPFTYHFDGFVYI